MEILRTFDLLENLKSYPPKEDILARRTRGKWIKYSIDQYYDISHTVAYGLLAFAIILPIVYFAAKWLLAD